MTSYYCGPPDIDTAINLIETETIKVDDMITRRLPLRDIAEGFRLVMAGKESLKIIIKPHQ
jgi:threonine dehydrogenase-like Zn-dependent dehydrogenase